MAIADDAQKSHVVRSVLLDLSDYFAELNDDPDAVLGELARIKGRNPDDGTLAVYHDSEPWGVEISVRWVELPEGFEV